MTVPALQASPENPERFEFLLPRSRPRRLSRGRLHRLPHQARAAARAVSPRSYVRSQKRCWAIAATKFSLKPESSVAITTPAGLPSSDSCAYDCPVFATPIGLK